VAWLVTYAEIVLCTAGMLLVVAVLAFVSILVQSWAPFFSTGKALDMVPGTYPICCSWRTICAGSRIEGRNVSLFCQWRAGLSPGIQGFSSQRSGLNGASETWGGHSLPWRCSN
jgi:hypothetical protein